jgi:hypothetical protein
MRRIRGMDNTQQLAFVREVLCSNVNRTTGDEAPLPSFLVSPEDRRDPMLLRTPLFTVEMDELDLSRGTLAHCFAVPCFGVTTPGSDNAFTFRVSYRAFADVPRVYAAINIEEDLGKDTSGASATVFAHLVFRNDPLGGAGAAASAGAGAVKRTFASGFRLRGGEWRTERSLLRPFPFLPTSRTWVRVAFTPTVGDRWVATVAVNGEPVNRFAVPLAAGLREGCRLVIRFPAVGDCREVSSLRVFAAFRGFLRPTPEDAAHALATVEASGALHVPGLIKITGVPHTTITGDVVSFFKAFGAQRDQTLVEADKGRAYIQFHDTSTEVFEYLTRHTASALLLGVRVHIERVPVHMCPPFFASPP